MNNWDNSSMFDMTEPPMTDNRPGKGKWCVVLTVLSLVLGLGLTVLMCFLTRNVQNRPIWMMGLIFTVPVAGVMFAGYLTDRAGNVMTPSSTRSAQLAVIAVTCAAVFGLACICDGIYLGAGLSAEAADDVEFLIYERGHAGSSAVDTASVNVIRELKRRTGGRVNVGVYMFDWDLDTEPGTPGHTYVPLGPLDDGQMGKIERMLLNGEKQVPVAFGISQAYSEVERINSPRKTRVFVMTVDGSITYADENLTSAEMASLVDYLNGLGISVYVMGTEVKDNTLITVCRETGGKVVTDFSADSMEASLIKAALRDGDILRVNTDSAQLLSGIMILLIGLVIGFGMTLLLSVRGQKRFQMLLSPLLAVLAFVILRVIQPGIPGWLLEGLCLGMICIVVMTTNNAAGYSERTSPAPAGETFAQGDGPTFGNW